jgi:hypothetical protein
MKPSRAKSYAITANGVLKKRAELIRANRDRPERIEEDLRAIDRVLRLLDFAGDIEAASRFRKRETLYQPGELSRLILAQLRAAARPLSSREIAEKVLTTRWQAVDGISPPADHARRVSKALHVLKGKRLVRAIEGARPVWWEIRPA